MSQTAAANATTAIQVLTAPIAFDHVHARTGQVIAYCEWMAGAWIANWNVVATPDGRLHTFLISEDEGKSWQCARTFDEPKTKPHPAARLRSLKSRGEWYDVVVGPVIGRPRRDPAAARVRVSYRVHPDTQRAIDDEAKRTMEGAGQVLDRLAASLPR